MFEICGGWDDREIQGYNLCQFSILRRTSCPLRFQPIKAQVMRYWGLYTRPHEERDGRLWDPISEAFMATSFANSRFLVPWIAEGQTVLWMDFADMLVVDDIAELFALRDSRFAVQVVKREEYTSTDTQKMDGQAQQPYARKGWSSVILWNLDHPAHNRLTLDMVNTLPGRDLHAFCWLDDDEIGDLPRQWNHFVGVDPDDAKVSCAHFTLGTPEVACGEGPWVKRWMSELAIMDASRRSIWLNAGISDRPIRAQSLA